MPSVSVRAREYSGLGETVDVWDLFQCMERFVLVIPVTGDRFARENS